MGQALYRKYRSRSFDDVVGQEHVIRTLKKAIEQGRVSHAYLFTGPRGVGKTSVARIFAHDINGLPYEDDSSHMDIIEIDAASNRRIDEIRELRDKVYVAPTSAKYKVYIIDEVHMLTREAFNALLKTLEEPPAHVVFILATTDAHKLPETIISRTQRFSFAPANNTKVVELLDQIAKAEKINIEEPALSLIAEHGGGSFRDSVSLLDQLGNQTSKIEVKDIERLLGLPPSGATEKLLLSLAGQSTAADLIQSLSDMFDQGFTASLISKQICQSLRQQIIDNKLILPTNTTLRLLSDLIEVPISHSPERALEISLLKAVPIELYKSIQIEKVELTAEVQDYEEPEQTKIVRSPKVALTAFDAEMWTEVLKALKKQYNTLYGIARMAEPDFSENGKLILAFAFGFHQKRLNEESNRQRITKIIKELSGEAITIECIVDKSAKPPKPTVELEEVKPAETKPDEKTEAGDLSAISNIFGNAELLES